MPDLQIIEANGRAFSPSQYKGHIVVLEFGSMSCPVFRTHAQEMEKLKAIEGARAFFLIVYTREAFPAGDKNVERNRDEGVSVPEAKSLNDRKAQALEAQRELRITIPVAVDSMDDSVSNAFGGYPNGVVVIGKDGKIAARQQWTNPDTLRTAIDEAVFAPATAGNDPCPIRIHSALLSGGAKHRGLGCDDPHPIPASTRQSSAFDRSPKVDKGDTTL